MSGLRPLAAIRIGEEMTPLSRAVSQDQIAAYAKAAGDPNPIHLDPEFARGVGLPGTIAHGMLDMAILAEAVGRWVGSYEGVLELGCRFSKPLLPGETITCTGRVVSLEEASGTVTLQLEATSSRGERVLTNGRAVVRLGD